MVPSERTKGTGHKLDHRRLHPNIRKPSFVVQVTAHWHRLPREAAKSPSVELSKSHLDMVLDNLLQVTLLEEVAGPGGLQRALPTSAFR